MITKTTNSAVPHRRAYRLALLMLFVFGGAATLGGKAQSGNGAPRVTTHNAEDGLGHEGPGLDPQMRERMALRRNDDRQKQLVADTDKLLLLAQELHDAVAKSNKDELALPVLKKSEEIEKLAKSVKERMRGY